MNVTSLCNTILNKISTARVALPTIPSILLFCSAIKRPGLSSMLTAARIIQRLPEAGIPNTVNEDGSENITAAYTRILVEELFDEIKLSGRVQAAAAAGSVSIIGVGSNAGGPVTVKGYNISPFRVDGILN